MGEGARSDSVDSSRAAPRFRAGKARTTLVPAILAGTQTGKSMFVYPWEEHWNGCKYMIINTSNYI